MAPSAVLDPALIVKVGRNRPMYATKLKRVFDVGLVFLASRLIVLILLLTALAVFASVDLRSSSCSPGWACAGGRSTSSNSRP